MLIKAFRERIRPYTWVRYMMQRGLMAGDELWNSRRFFGQFGEDAMLSNLFRKKERGFYVEVGAFEPLLFSNSYWFYARGWRGICIEPNPELFVRFRDRRPRDTVLNLAVSHAAGEADFLCSAAFSGIHDESYTGPEHSGKEHLIKVKTLPLREILRAHVPSGINIDFMSVDCEGHDLSVLDSNDWSLFRPAFVLVEDHSGNPESPIVKRMRNWGYAFLCHMGLTTFFEDAEASSA